MNTKFFFWIRKRWLVLLFLISSMVVLYIFSQYGFITIIVENSGGSEITYQLLNQKNRKKTSIKSTSGQTKKLVPKGSYELLVNSGNSSYFEVINTGGFIKSTTVKADLKPQVAFEFIGNNPGACMYLENGVLYSYDCGAGAINTHVPATPSAPSYVLENNVPPGDSVGGFTQTTNGTFALVSKTDIESGEDSELDNVPIVNSIKSMNGGILSSVDISQPKELNSERTYSLLSMRDGFVAYSSTLDDFWKFSSPESPPTKINVNAAQKSDLTPSLAGVFEDYIYVINTNSEEGYDPSISNAKNLVNEIVVVKDGVSRHFSFNEDVVGVCGKELICTLNKEVLSVYDISSGKPRMQYAMTNVNYAWGTSKGIFVTRSNELMLINPETSAGYVVYELGKYTYCGNAASPSGQLLCLINNQSKKVALLLNFGVARTDEIDKKISELQDKQEVKDVSIYKNIIHITPNFGDLVYNGDLGAYEYNPITKNSIINSVNKSIDEIGIDRKVYQITVVGS